MSHRFKCPFCEQRFVQDQNPDGPNFCPTCRRLFLVEQFRKVPDWVLGVGTFLMVRWFVLR